MWSEWNVFRLFLMLQLHLPCTLVYDQMTCQSNDILIHHRLYLANVSIANGVAYIDMITNEDHKWHVSLSIYLKAPLWRLYPCPGHVHYLVNPYEILKYFSVEY